MLQENHDESVQLDQRTQYLKLYRLSKHNASAKCQLFCAESYLSSLTLSS